MKNLRERLLLLAAGSLLTGAALYATWRYLCSVSIAYLAAALIVATLIVPVAFWAGWYFGHFEARGRLQGIDQAVDRLGAAMATGANVGSKAATAARRDTPVYDAQPRLTYRVSDSNDVIDL